MSHFLCHLSPATCLALPTFQGMLVRTDFMLKPVKALLPGELNGTTDTQTLQLIVQCSLVHCRVVQVFAVQCSSVQYTAVHLWKMQFSAVMYNVGHDSVV